MVSRAMSGTIPHKGKNTLSDNASRSLWTGLSYQEKGKEKKKEKYSIL
jgi:hypothetical protein